VRALGQAGHPPTLLREASATSICRVACRILDAGVFADPIFSFGLCETKKEAQFASEVIRRYLEGQMGDSKAVAVPDDIVGSRIKAYVVRLGDNEVSPADIDTQCQERLQRYMVPESFEILEALPKASSSKVDRSLLARR